MSAICKRLTGTLLCVTSFLFGYSMPLAAQDSVDNSTQRWSCTTDNTNGGWRCSQIEKPPHNNRYVPMANYRRITTIPEQQKDPGQTALQTHLDWVPVGQLSPEKRAEIAPFCKGAYVEPAYVAPELLALDPATQPILGSSIESKTTEDGISTLDGDVIISQGYRQVKSERALIDRTTSVATIDGEAQYREPGILLKGYDTQINLKTKEVSTQNVEFVSHDTRMRGQAKQLKRETDGIVRITDASITQCAPGDDAWALTGSSIDLDRERGVGTARHAKLKIKNIPVLYTPYLQFPIDERRKTGILFPHISSSDDGADISVPIYLNLAPNYDATFIPRYISDRGTMAESEFRYLHSNNSGVIGGAWLGSDDGFNDEDRWLLSVDHKGTLFDRIKTRVDYSAVSDEDYFSDLGTALSVSSRSHLLRKGQARYSRDYWDLTVLLQGYQSLDDFITDENESYDRLPQVLLDIDYPYANSGLRLGLLVEHTWFDRDNSNLKDLDRAVGQRSRLEPSISWNLEWPAAYIKPSVRYKYSTYDLEDLSAQFDDKPEISSPLYSLDAGIFFEREMHWNKAPMMQTFEPRLFYLKVPEEKGQDQIPDFDTSELTFGYNQLFREDRFTGGDRIGDADQLSVGLTSRILEDSGFERLRTSLGQTYYFEDRMVTLDGVLDDDYDTSESAFVAEFMYALQTGWRFMGDIEWDPALERTNASSLSLRYKSDNNRIFNLSYRLRSDRRKLEQTDISTLWPISSRWSVIARWNQDLIHDRVVEALAGLEYQSCCWSLRFAARRWVNDDDIYSADEVKEKDGIYLQIQLKGLAGIGQSLDGLLQDSIIGYQEQKNNGIFKQ